MSVNFPPNHDPITEPIPKKAKIEPISVSESPMSFLRYNDKNGMTMVPALFTNDISARNQISFDNPWNEAM